MVKDKITLCRQMLPESAGVNHDEAFSEVVGFLEACRPRMVDLVEAGIGGALEEDTFAQSLKVSQLYLQDRSRPSEAERSSLDAGWWSTGRRAQMAAIINCRLPYRHRCHPMIPLCCSII